MEEGLGAAGSFVAMNNRVSQSVPHLHVHIVPRNRKDGLRGFFWPRTKYESEEEAREYADRLRAAMATRLTPLGGGWRGVTGVQRRGGCIAETWNF